MNALETCTFLTKYNQTQHQVEIYLDNGVQQHCINPNSIVNLNIEDTLADWVTKGTISMLYFPEGTKTNSVNQSTGNRYSAQTGIRVGDNPGFYIFRNDGRDYLRIKITPRVDNSVPNSLSISDNSVEWTLSYHFSIYEIEDIDLPPGAQNAASANIKCLKIYFWDSWYQKLNTNILEYSTALSPEADIEGDKTAGIHSNYGMIPTGTALKEIIQESLKTSDLPNIKTLVGESKEEWEDGASRIFYTAPAQTTAFESLMYVYEQHISNVKYNDTNDVSILIKEKGPKASDTGYLTLRPLSYYFKKSTDGGSPGEWQIEHFFLQSYADVYNTGVVNTSPPTKMYKAPLDPGSSSTVDVKSTKYNTITNYRFVDIASVINTGNFCSSPVYSFDFKNRVFNIEFQNNTVLKAREFITQKYIKSLYKKEGSGNELFLINIDQDKENKNLTPAFSLYGDISEDDTLMRQLPGIQKLLYLGVFQNTCINFRTLGLSHREPGRFIAIDKTEGVESGPFEDKFFGQWFIINVKHIFETEMYYNDITAVKIHRYEDSNLSFPGTI
jgi:hypothetical protein